MTKYVFGETYTAVRKFEVKAGSFEAAREIFLADRTDLNTIRETDYEVVKSEWWCENNARTD